jgi:hypothetical protein
MIKSRRMRWVGHVARMEREQEYIDVFIGKSRRKETTRKT